MFNRGQAKHDPEHKGKFVDQLFLEDRNPVRDDSAGRSSNSLRAGYMESLGGAESLSIETARELPRQVTTHCARVYKMKRISREVAPIYDQVLREVTGHASL